MGESVQAHNGVKPINGSSKESVQVTQATQPIIAPPLPRLGDVIVAHRDFNPPQLDLGYLAIRSGERFEVLHVGENGTDEEGWLYVRRWFAEEAEGKADEQGWLNLLCLV